MQFEKDHTMIVAGSTSQRGQGLEPMIRGHKANLYLGSRQLRPAPGAGIYVGRSSIERDASTASDIRNEQNELRLDWLNCVRTRSRRTSADSGIEHATKIMVIVDLATRSMWTGKAWQFDPKTMQARAV